MRFRRRVIPALLVLLAIGAFAGLIGIVVVVAGETDIDVAGEQQFNVAAACSGGVQITAPASDLAGVVNGHPAGTCFVLANGTYRFSNVVPKDGMIFVGQSTSGVIIDGRGRENAFHGTADGVRISNMTFDRFDSSAGHSRQEQAPIRGTSGIWESNRGEMATNWVIENIVSSNNYAAGLFMGEHFTVRNSTFRNNGVTGIGGDHFVGGLIEGNVVHGNGAHQASGALVNGGGMKFAQAGTPSAPVVIRNNEVYDNPKIGIWCDIGCDGFHVLDNYIYNHVSRGVMIELSSNAVIRGNTVLNSNTWTGFTSDFNAGAITIGESSKSVVENNLIDGAEAGVVIRQTHRPHNGEEFLYNYPYVNWVSTDVVVRDNVIRNTDHMGISTGASGTNQIPNVNSIVFTGNSYDNPGAMTFWWNNTERMSYQQWQSAGRDTAANGSSPAVDTSGNGPSESGVAPQNRAPGQTPQEGSGAASTSTVPAPALPIRINAGGGALTDSTGTLWQADTYFVGGTTASHAAGVDIRGTESDDLYRAERWGDARYEIPVPNGEYIVRVHHAEVYDGCQQVGCRKFSVAIAGHGAFADLDIYRDIGGYTAHVVEVRTVVSNSVLNIELDSSVQEPQISAIEVLAATSENETGSSPSTTASDSGTTNGAGADTTGADGAGGDGTVADSAGVDSTGVDSTGVDSTGVDGSSVDSAGRDGSGADSTDGPIGDSGTAATSARGATSHPDTTSDAPEEDPPTGLALIEQQERQRLPGGIIMILAGCIATVALAGIGLRAWAMHRH